jgi:catechol 2,3-dioxygenase-like lactoylglutathione lyase family enzyme
MSTPELGEASRGPRFSHVVVNVSDLARSVAFYERATPLRRAARTEVPEQAFASLGIRRGRYDGWVLRDPSSDSGPAVHLVEWQSPDPVGSPYDVFWHVGFFRICMKSEDVPGVYRDVVAAGGVPFTELLMPEGQSLVVAVDQGLPDLGSGRPSFCVPDPDGVVLQNVTLPGVERLFHTNVNCSDLAASRSFYEALGMRAYIEPRTDVPTVFPFGTGGEMATFEAALFECPGVPTPDDMPVFSLDVCRWTMPERTGTPYETQNHLGIVRLGVAVSDLVRVRAELMTRGSSVSGVEEHNFGAEVGTRNAVVVSDPDGATVELVDRPL